MLGKSLLLLAALSAAPLAHAQFGVYADFTAERLSGQQSAPGNTGTAYNSSVNPTGGTFGAFYDFRNVGPVRLGVDARASHITDNRSAAVQFVGSGTHIYSGLGGIRASFHTPVKLLLPYVQGSIGAGRSDFGMQGGGYHTGLEYHVYAGADYNILPFLGWRVVELGYGGIENNHNFPIASVSTGIVLRFGN